VKAALAAKEEKKRKKTKRTPRRMALLFALGCAALFGVEYAASPHQSLLRRNFLPGYWLLALEGKTDFDPDLNILRHGNPELHEVAITIDDGPHPENALPLLDVLKAEKVPATFYVVGSEAKKHPEILRRMVAEGHEIGNHTNDHLRLPGLTDPQVRNEIKDDEINVHRAVPGYEIRTLRPPGGEFNERTAKRTKDLGYVTVLWSDTSGDYEDQSPDHIVDRVMDGLENGAIILLHDAHPGTVRALPLLLRKIKARDYRTVTISEMVSHLPKK
jgi:peptidoglycan/xylan/chitin deacetylase (PgdA/CDA1 family)